MKSDWDAWNALSLKDEPIIRLVLDGTAPQNFFDKLDLEFHFTVDLCAHLKTPNARPSHGAKFDYRSSAAEFAFLCGGEGDMTDQLCGIEAEKASTSRSPLSAFVH